MFLKIEVCWIGMLVSLFLQGCTTAKKEKEIIDGKYRIVGSISQNTIYQGLIKFYDIKSGQLLYEANYDKGKQNGVAKSYDANGDLIAVENFENDKLNGFSYHGDSSKGNYSKVFYYYGLRVGETVNYKQWKPITYNFFSLENKNLFQINYDSVPGKKIAEMQHKFFFLYVNNFDRFEDGHFEPDERECFIYMPKPPRYKFDYSLVIIDSLYKVISTLRKIEDDGPFTTFPIPRYSDTSNQTEIAIKLDIYDSTNDLTGHFFKKMVAY